MPTKKIMTTRIVIDYDYEYEVHVKRMWTFSYLFIFVSTIGIAITGEHIIPNTIMKIALLFGMCSAGYWSYPFFMMDKDDSQ